MGIRIKAKKDGLDLFAHSSSVIDTAYYINKKLGVGIDNKVLYWFGVLHDIGKANPLFQSNMERNNFDDICRHEISSLLFINAVPKKIRDQVALCILSHHKPYEGDGRSIVNLYNERPNILFTNHIGDINEWGKTVKEYLEYHYNIKVRVPKPETCKDIIEKYVKMYFERYSDEKGIALDRGVCMMADHLASFKTNDTERIKLLDTKLFKTPSTDCFDRPNEKYPLSLVKSDKTKDHTLVIAPCGVGKTDMVVRRCDGTRRIFYMLPYQASINAMYQRLNANIDSLVTLLHSALKSIELIDDETYDLCRFFGSAVKVMTPHQMMSILFRLKGYESLLLDVRNSDIILDEIHTYDGLTRTCVLELIKTLKTNGCRIHICSATIPTALKEEILSILDKDKVQEIQLNEEQMDSFDKHELHCVDKGFSQEIIDDVVRRYNNNEKILVVRNQKQNAIKTYIELKNALVSNGIENPNIVLLHSSFERQCRAKIENNLKHNNSVSGPYVLVSTQVVEVSLDVNFDILYTDCADIMSLVQRFGRVNRQRDHIGVIRPIYILNTFEKDFLPYDKDIVSATYQILKEYDGKILPQRDIQTIIDRVHPVVPIVKSSRATPFDKSGRWKSPKYTHVTNTSLSEELDIDIYVGAVISKILPFDDGVSDGMMIPISKGDIKRLNLSYNEKYRVYDVPPSSYNSELGLH